MTNEQKANELATTVGSTSQYIYSLCLQMAEWKDKQFAEELEENRKQMLDKIERVIKKVLGGYVIRNFHYGDSYRINELAKDIRKAMEE